MNSYFDDSTKTGTAFGTLLIIFANITSEDLLKTALLAGIGAVVSFTVTILLKFLFKKHKK